MKNKQMSYKKMALAYKTVLSLVPTLPEEVRRSPSALISAINAGLMVNGVKPFEVRNK